MEIIISSKEVQEIMDIEYDVLLNDMDNLCQLINDIEIEDDEFSFDN